MTEEVPATGERLPQQTRALLFEISGRASPEDGIPVVVSSDAIVEVADGPEILSHDPDAIDLQRAPLPIIATHRGQQVNVGIVDGLRPSGGQLRGVARFGSRPEAAGYRDDVLSGIIRSVSVGYARIKSVLRKDGVLVTARWMPSHVAMVAEPADVRAGFFRESNAAPLFEMTTEAEARETASDAASAAVSEGLATVSRSTPPASTADNHEVITMTDQVTASAGASADVRNDSAALERLRIQTIHKLAEQHKIPSAEREAWISEGVSVDEASRKVLDVLAERGSRNPETSVAAVGLSSKEAKQYSMFKAVRAVLDKNWSKAGLEFEAHKEIAKRVNQNVNENTFYVPLEVQKRPVAQRDLSVAANGGGYLVETSNQGFIELLRNNSVAFRAGATRLSGLVGNVNIPKHSAAATAYWLASETATIDESQQTIVQVPLTPKTVGAYTEISRLLLLQSSPDAEGIVMADLAAVTAIAMDKAALHGGGGGGAPQGIVGSSNVGSVTATSIGTNTYGKMLEFQTDLAASNALQGSLAYVTTPVVAGLLATYPRFASTDTPVWDGNILNANMCGLPAFTSNQLEAGYMIFGNWSDLIIGEWGVLAVEANPYANFQAGIVGVRAMYTVDIALRRGQSFSVATSVAA
jgi:HK97 family phage major capsid protein